MSKRLRFLISFTFVVGVFLNCPSKAADPNLVGWGNNTGTEKIEFRVSEYRLRCEHGSGSRLGNTFVNDNQWHYVVLTV